MGSSGNFSFNLTIQTFARQLEILTNRTTSLTVCSAFDTTRFSSLVIDWLVENIIPDVTIDRMSLVVILLDVYLKSVKIQKCPYLKGNKVISPSKKNQFCVFYLVGYNDTAAT